MLKGSRTGSENGMSDIDWKTELRKIEREYDGLPPAPSPAVQRMKREAEQAARDRVARLWVVARLAPVLALGAALPFWPYYARCGLELAGYLGAIAALVAGGLWIASLTWKHRMPLTHALSVLVIVWGLAMTAREVLPREGYARADVERASWKCRA